MYNNPTHKLGLAVIIDGNIDDITEADLGEEDTLMPHKSKNGHAFDDHRQNDHEQSAKHFSQEEAQFLSENTDDELLEEEKPEHTTITTLLEHGEKYHEAGKRDVELYIRTYNTLLRSSGEINLKALVQAHYNIDSSLHPDARKPLS